MEPTRARLSVLDAAKNAGAAVLSHAPLSHASTRVIADYNQATCVDPNPQCGHVFLLNCACKGLAADAILIPVRDLNNDGNVKDEASRVKRGTVNVLTPKEVEAEGHIGVSHCFEGQISTDLYTEESEAMKGTMQVVDAFLLAAGSAVQGTRSAFKRAKPLIALPMPGVGKMDESNLIDEMGSLLRPLLARLYQAASDYEIDIALCTIDT